MAKSYLVVAEGGWGDRMLVFESKACRSVARGAIVFNHPGETRRRLKKQESTHADKELSLRIPVPGCSAPLMHLHYKQHGSPCLLAALFGIRPLDLNLPKVRTAFLPPL